MTHEPIRKALAAGPTSGEWKEGVAYGSVVSVNAVDDGPRGCDDTEIYGGHLIAESVSAKNRAYIAACNPEAIAALLADLDRVTRERDEALTVLADARGTIVELCESFGVPKPLATLGRIDAALGDVGV